MWYNVMCDVICHVWWRVMWSNGMWDVWCMWNVCVWQGNCVVMIHGNPGKNTGMWASRPCEMEKHAFLCQRRQGASFITSTTITIQSYNTLTIQSSLWDTSYYWGRLWTFNGHNLSPRSHTLNLLNTRRCNTITSLFLSLSTWTTAVFLRPRPPPSPRPHPPLLLGALEARPVYLPGGPEAPGLDGGSARVRVSERDPSQCAGPLPAGLPHPANEQPAPVRLDRPLQQRGEGGIFQGDQWPVFYRTKNAVFKFG